MRQPKTFFCFFFSLSFSLLGCGGKNGNAGADPKAVAEADAISGASSSGDATFSAMVDGKPVAGKGIDELQLDNTAFIYPDDNNGKKLLFDLLSTKVADDFYTLRFRFPDKAGQYRIMNGKGEGCKCSVNFGFNLKSADNYSMYNADSATVIINEITPSRIAGTFTGKFKLSDLTRAKVYKDHIDVTDGKFDIPFSTGNLKPE